MLHARVVYNGLISLLTSWVYFQTAQSLSCLCVLVTLLIISEDKERTYTLLLYNQFHRSQRRYRLQNNYNRYMYIHVHTIGTCTYYWYMYILYSVYMYNGTSIIRTLPESTTTTFLYKPTYEMRTPL